MHRLRAKWINYTFRPLSDPIFKRGDLIWMYDRGAFSHMSYLRGEKWRINNLPWNKSLRNFAEDRRFSVCFFFEKFIEFLSIISVFENLATSTSENRCTKCRRPQKYCIIMQIMEDPFLCRWTRLDFGKCRRLTYNSFIAILKLNHGVGSFKTWTIVIFI